jgi:hypothetical protein
MSDLIISDLIRQAMTVLRPRELYLDNRAGDVVFDLLSLDNVDNRIKKSINNN